MKHIDSMRCPAKTRIWRLLGRPVSNVEIYQTGPSRLRNARRARTIAGILVEHGHLILAGFARPVPAGGSDLDGTQVAIRPTASPAADYSRRTLTATRPAGGPQRALHVVILEGWTPIATARVAVSFWLPAGRLRSQGSLHPNHER